MTDPSLTIEFWRQFAIAAACGSLIGLERQLHGKPMGIRTGLLICVATEIFVMLGSQMAGPHGDPTRVLGQVVTGIGFLGAGVIFNRGGAVSGITSAALIWCLAAIGCLVGLGLVVAPLVVTAVTVLAVTTIEQAERRLPQLRRGAHAARIADSDTSDESDEA